MKDHSHSEDSSEDSTAQELIGEEPDGPMNRSMRRRWLRGSLGAIILLLIGAGALILYATSDDALQRFLVPLAESALNAEIQAEGISFEFPLTIGIRRLLIRSHPVGLTAEVKGMRCSFEAVPLLLDRHARLSQFHADNVGLEFSPAKPEEDERAEEELAVVALRQKPWIPVEIAQGSITRLEFSLVDPERAEFRGTLLDLRLTALNYGARARMQSSLDSQLISRASDRIFDIGGEVGFEVQQSPDGRNVDWEVRSPINIQEDATESAEALRFRVDPSWEGALRSNGESTHDLAISTASGERDSGRIETSFALESLRHSEHSTRPLSVSAQIDGLQPALLNPILALFGPETLKSGTINGHLQLTLNGELAEIDSELTASDLSLRARGDRGDSPSLGGEFILEGTFERSRRELQLQRSRLQLHDDEHLLIQTDLTAPLTYRLRDEESTETLQTSMKARVSKATENGDAIPASELRVRLERIDLDRLRPWFIAWGSSALDDVERGHLLGEASLEFAPETRALAFQGVLLGENLYRRGRGLGEHAGPLEMELTFAGRSSNLQRFELEKCSVDLNDSAIRLAEADVAGSLNRSTGFASIIVDGRIPDLSYLLERLGWMDPESQVLLLEGETSTHVQIDREGSDRATEVGGTFGIKDAALDVRGKGLRRSAEGTFEMRIPPGTRRMESIRFQLESRESEGAPAGSLEGEGYWPLGLDHMEGERGSPGGIPAGKLGLRVRNLDLQPWLELFGYREEGGEERSWPAEADLTLTVDESGERFTLEGEERIGPVGPR